MWQEVIKLEGGEDILSSSWSDYTILKSCINVTYWRYSYRIGDKLLWELNSVCK